MRMETAAENTEEARERQSGGEGGLLRRERARRAPGELMDEPCSAPDPIATGRVEDLIYDLQGDYTVLVVTHNMQQASRISDYTAFLYLGRLVEYGPTADLFSRPCGKATENGITGPLRLRRNGE